MGLRRLLIVGCGDVGLRLAPLLAGRFRLLALSHSPERHALLRSRGVIPVTGDLDRRDSLGRIAGLAHCVVHLAPPPNRGSTDPRTANLLWALTKARMVPQTLVYISTTGVYGDCGGAQVSETRRVDPRTERARRRADAEARVRRWGRERAVRTVILRVPGIYGPQRLPLARLRSGAPALVPEQDPYTSHIHADDLAAIIVAALHRGRPSRIYNACDDSALKMGDYFDLVAERFGLPRPPRVSRAGAAQALPETLLSFMSESRRLVNRRMKRELKPRLRYPTVADGIACREKR